MIEHVPVREAGVFFPGDVIERKYRIVNLLAEGGMGSVYHAVQEPLGRDVALKVLKPGNDSPAERDARLKRFFREASVSSRLQHPNTVMIFDYGELADDQGFFLTMEFLHGCVLRDLMPPGSYLEPSLAIHIAMQIAGSLAEAHAAGVVHRDLKPPNVMIVERGGDPFFVKVVDFGIVKDLEDNNNDELTAENTLLGSPTYMAPERFLSTKSDSPAVDIYALGILLYEMLVGRPPFQREGEATVHQLIMAHIQSDPPPLRTFQPDIMLPDGLEELIMRCLAKQPEDRIASMDMLLRMLKTVASRVDGFSTNGSFEFVAPPLKQNFGVHHATNDTGPGIAQHTQETVNAFHRPDAPAPPPTGASPQPFTEPTAVDSTQLPQTHAGRQNKFLLTAIGVLAVFILALSAFLVLAPKNNDATDTIATDSLTTARAPIELFAQSEPTGAIVYLGDQELGRTPLRLKVALPTGSILRFALEDFEDYSHIVSANSDDTSDGNSDGTLQLRAQLEPAKSPEKIDEPIARENPDEVEEAVAKPANQVKKQPVSSKKSSKSGGKQREPEKTPNLDIKLDR